jgi:hypothetical protein
VLDLLNTTLFVSYSDLRTARLRPKTSSEVSFDLSEAGVEIKPQTTQLVGLTNKRADTIALVTSLANSTDLEQGATVARVRVITDDGEQIDRELRAGVDTAEWAHERPDVAPVIKHKLATIFDRQVGDAANSYQACRFVTRIKLEKQVAVREVQLTNLSSHATLALWAASLFDSGSKQTEALSRKLLYLQGDPARWQIERRPDEVLVAHNKRALPRAWLVAEAESVDGEEALRRIRGESNIQFDPRRTALLEVIPEQLPQLPGGDAAANSTAQIVGYGPNGLRIETSAATPTILVISETFYPGWEATIDGQPTQIFLTDYVLRGVSLPAGKHTVEMRYRAPAARNGAIISALTLTLMASLFLYTKLSRRRLLSGSR